MCEKMKMLVLDRDVLFLAQICLMVKKAEWENLEGR